MRFCQSRDGMPMSRRRMLAASGGALAAVSGSVGLLRSRGEAREGAPPAAPAEPYGPFKMGLQSYSLRGYTANGKPDLDKALKVTRGLGLHYWESYSGMIPPDPKTADAQRKRAADAGVAVIGYGVVPLKKDAAANRNFFEFARAMGIAYLSADPDPDAFDTLDKLVEEYGVAVGIHNHGPGHRWALIDTIASAIKDHHPKVGCCVDTGHFLRSKEDPVRAVEVFGKRVYGVHLKDVKDATTFTVMGKGDLRTEALLKALAGLRYDHALALEYEEHPEDPAAEIEECLAAVRAAVAQIKPA